MPVVVRRERRKKVCARVALDTLLGGRSSAALERRVPPLCFSCVRRCSCRSTPLANT